MASPTPLDFMNSMMYALDRISNENCNDPYIKKTYEAKIGWASREQNRTYPCSLPNANGGEYKLPNCQHGNCRFLTEDLCLLQGKYPYDENNQPLSTQICKTDDDCKNVPFKAMCGTVDPATKVQTCIPSQPYLEYRSDPDNPQNNICTYGNTSLKNWCLNPAIRNTSSVKGQTDVPPFVYDAKEGQCKMSPKYCDWMGVTYQANPPDCIIPGGQAFVENWLVGKTIFRDLEYLRKNGHFQTTIKLVDDQHVQNKKMIGKDFGGKDVDLYFIIWKQNTNKIDKTCLKPNVGFLASDIKKTFPQILEKRNGNYFIKIDRNSLLKNPELRRVYVICRSSNWLAETFLHFFNKEEEKKNKR
jgi:hypothetical protein